MTSSLSEIQKKCPTKQGNMTRCNCTYEPCPRKGLCCECMAYHLGANELPACCFPDNVERTYDRSFRRFAKIYK